MEKNALIIGGSGSLSSALVEKLQKLGTYCYNISKSNNDKCNENIIIDLSKYYEFAELNKILNVINKILFNSLVSSDTYCCHIYVGSCL